MREVYTNSSILKPRKSYPFRCIVRVEHSLPNADWITGSHHKTREAAEAALEGWKTNQRLKFIEGEVKEN